HPDDEKQVLNRVTVQRQGTLSFPVDITLIDAQGQVYHESWNGEGTHLELIRSTPQAITTVCVDPERRIVIDDDPSDNCRRLDPPAISRYWMSWLLALQTLVLGLSW